MNPAARVSPSTCAGPDESGFQTGEAAQIPVRGALFLGPGSIYGRSEAEGTRITRLFLALLWTVVS